MKRLTILLILLILQVMVTAQLHCTVTYMHKYRHGLVHHYNLTVNDSLSFSQALSRREKQDSILGSSFKGHSTYRNYSSHVEMFQSFLEGRYKLTVRKSFDTLNITYVDSTKDILGYTCRKAIIHHQYDSITAWYALALPTPAGPIDAYGLPGLILEEDQFNNPLTAVSITFETKPVVEPQGGRMITYEEWQQLRKQIDGPDIIIMHLN